MPIRNTAAAKRFLGKAMNGLKDWKKPTVINTDKAPTYVAALAELKQLIRGFKTLKTMYATIKGFEVMHALRKGAGTGFNITRDIRGEARIVERAFGLGTSVLAESVQLVDEQRDLAAA